MTERPSMSDVKHSEPVYRLRKSAEGRVLAIEIHAKYLNYDISDSLKLQLREAVQQEIDQGVRHYVLDLSRVSIVDSCGVGLMIGLQLFAANPLSGCGPGAWIVASGSELKAHNLLGQLLGLGLRLQSEQFRQLFEVVPARHRPHSIADRILCAFAEC